MIRNILIALLLILAALTIGDIAGTIAARIAYYETESRLAN